MPSTLGRFGFTGTTVPPNGWVRTFHISVRPTVPGLSVAPITATRRGEKIASSPGRSSGRMSLAGSSRIAGAAAGFASDVFLVRAISVRVCLA